jgi:phosphatidylglycerol:prolipoprotein diacylglycerol transferase
VHPVLFEIPVPRWGLAAAPSFAILAIALLAIAELGRRARNSELVGVGGFGALASLLAAFRYRGQTFVLEPIPIYGFGALVCTGLLVGWFVTLGLAERDGLSREKIGACYFTAAVSGMVGARVLYVLTNPGDFHSLGDVLAFRGGGLVYYGGILGGFVGSLAQARKARVPWFAWADVAAPSLAVGSVFGRLGCYLAGCDYGLPLGPGAPRFLALLGTFPRWPDAVAGAGAGSPAWLDQVLYRGLPLDSTASLPVHPTQLYESVLAACLLAALLAVRARRRFRGQVFLTYLIGYGMLRYLLEIVRDDPERGFYGPHAGANVLVPLGLSLVAAAFVVGPVRALEGKVPRAVAAAAALSCVVATALRLRNTTAPIQLSTSQWIAIGSACLAAALWKRLDTPFRADGEGDQGGRSGASGSAVEAGRGNAAEPLAER